MHTCAASLLKYAAMTLLGPALPKMFGRQETVFTSRRCSLDPKFAVAWARLSRLESFLALQLHSILPTRLDAKRRNARLWRIALGTRAQPW